MKYPQKYGRAGNSTTYCSVHCNAVYNQNTIDRWMKGCILHIPKKGDLGIAKNYRGITLTSIEAKLYNALLQNRIEPKVEKIPRKNQKAFGKNDPRHHKFDYPSNSRMCKGKKTRGYNIICRLLQGL